MDADFIEFIMILILGVLAIVAFFYQVKKGNKAIDKFADELEKVAKEYDKKQKNMHQTNVYIQKNYYNSKDKD